MRADAQRNRDRIVEVAREVFREQGYQASLDLVAKLAEVGPGTLYRHFPTREDLVDAVMQTWVDRVTHTVEDVLHQGGAPRELLLRWFTGYVELVSLHKGGAAKITSAMGDPTSPIMAKCGVLTRAAAQVVDALEAQHALRPGVDAVQMCRLVGGVAAVADQGGLDAAAVRPLLEVLADGMLVPEPALAR